MREKKRIYWLDLVRCLAILCVLMVHAVEAGYTMRVEALTQLSLKSELFAFLGFTAGRMGVPLFLFLSGYLMLDRPYDRESSLRFWKSKCVELLVLSEVWVLLYTAFLVLVQHNTFSVRVLLLRMLFFKEMGLSHFWYMPMLLGLYLFLPIVANVVQKLEEKQIWVLLAVSVVYLFVVPVVVVIAGANGDSAIVSGVNTGFSGGYYGIYLVLGYCVKRGMFRKVPTWALVLLTPVSFLGNIWLQMYAYALEYQYNVWYNCAFLLLCSLALFELLSRLPEDFAPLHGLVRHLARLSFGIYLTHNLFRPALKNYAAAYKSGPVRVALIWGGMLLCAWALSWVISKVPKVGKRLLYMK